MGAEDRARRRSEGDDQLLPQADADMNRFRSRYRAGDRVEVKSREEILATLDHEGALDKLPFMPEMLRYCGERLTVVASAHKTCDTVNKTGGRRMHDAVHLEGLRCEGSVHGGCQARCL